MLDPSAPPKITAGLLPTPPGKPRFRHLSGPEMDERKEKGLCFNCDQRWSRNHKCGARIFLMLTNDDNDVVTGDLDSAVAQLDSGNVEVVSEAAQLSLHALSSDQAGDTFRVQGIIGSHSVSVLVEGGSTHNFIRGSVVDKLGLSLDLITSFRVMVGSGQVLLCSHACREVTVLIQGHKFCLDLFVLDLRGTDLVLGVQWLKHIGLVLMNYSTMSLTFLYNNSTIELHGDTTPHSMSLHSFNKLTRIEPEAQLFSFHISNPDTNLIHPPPNTGPEPIPTLPDLATLEPQVQTIITQYSHLFSEPSALPPPRITDHTIPLAPHASPVKVQPYRYPHSQKHEIEKQVAKLISTGWIQPNTSPFSSPVLLLKKKDGSWRMCVDYRSLNAITVRDRFPLPTIDELLDELGKARVFSKLDLTSGFHQIRVAPEDLHKTMFCTHDGHYEYRVMPFGLCNAPSTFQAIMNDIFRSLLRKTVIVFFDDILVFSSSMDEHAGHLSQVFSILNTHQFHLRPSKCSFGQRQIAYLGHIVADGTVAPDPSKIQGVIDWPTPKSTKSLHVFLGLSGFYRRFVKGYASIAHPLTSLLKKNSFEWSVGAQDAFEALKLALTSAPILSLPDFNIPFVIQSDASGYAMGAVLLQNNHPIAYFSKLFCPRMARASTYLRELHAITCAVKRWRQYLLGNFFIIQTDHRSLKELLTQVIQTPEQQLYLSKLLGYHYEIHYRSGKSNVVADALSRGPEIPTAELQLLSTPQFLFIEELRQELAADVPYQDLCRKVLAEPLVIACLFVSLFVSCHIGIGKED